MIKQEKSYALNAICPYFTMFPLDFPLSILKKYASKDQWVLDPFCGRGTTNYASRVLEMPSVGIDASPVAVALSEAKLANTNAKLIVTVAQRILDEVAIPKEKPQGEFWERLYDKRVLNIICRLREGLEKNCESDSRIALRAIILGTLHGPINKIYLSYFSNQCPRTYAPKPKYAVKFWKKNKLEAPFVDVLEIIKNRAIRYYENGLLKGNGKIIKGDSRSEKLFFQLDNCKINWVITSPPYYGMHTYIPDQWLRLWFLGGPDTVTYSDSKQLVHESLESFVSQLRKVWSNSAKVCSKNAQLVFRFGSINSRKSDPLAIIKNSLQDSGWNIKTIKNAGTASFGKRQVLHFFVDPEEALAEYDVWASLRNN